MEIDYFSKLVGIFIRPREFFSKYSKEKGITKPLIFLIITTAIVAIISMMFNWFTDGKPTALIYVFIDVIITAFLFAFLFSAIFHVGVKIAKGKAPYYQTFKAFAYTSAFGIPFQVITLLTEPSPYIGFLGAILVIWLLLVLGYGLNKFTGLAGWVLGLIYLVSLVLFTIIGFWIEYGLLDLIPVEYL
ncbi:YIP1 family protein [Candidatus Woesearchaeota archaeon]|nr:YIP1 family protein [Candidatus Woesearchaeota archaeon]